MLTDIRFNWNEGTHKTLFKVIDVRVEWYNAGGFIVAEDPVGRLTWDIGDGSVFVKSVESEIMWTVAPLSRIQGFVNTKLIEPLQKGYKPATFA